MHFVYILKKGNKEWYIGYTNNLKRRLSEHQKVWPCELIYYEAFRLEKTARRREQKLKRYGSAWRALRKRVSA